MFNCIHQSCAPQRRRTKISSTTSEQGRQSAFSRSDSFSAVDLVGQLFLTSRLRGLFASGRRDVEPAILQARPLSVVTSAVNSFAVTWLQSVLGISATRGCVLLLAGAFVGLHWCRHSAGAFHGLHWCGHSALCFASPLLKQTDTRHSQCDSHFVLSAWPSR